jgi:hypothetical protein
MWGFFTVMMALTGGLAIVYFTFSQQHRENNRPYVYLTMLVGVVVLEIQNNRGRCFSFISRQQIKYTTTKCPLTRQTIISSIPIQVSFFVIAMFLMLADSIFSLYLSGGCYVGVVSAKWLFAGQILVGALTLMFAASTMVVSSDAATISMMITTVCLFVLYSIYCLIVAFMHYLTNHDWKPITFAILCFLSIFEVPFAVFGAGMVKELFTISRTRRQVRDVCSRLLVSRTCTRIHTYTHTRTLYSSLLPLSLSSSSSSSSLSS